MKTIITTFVLFLSLSLTAQSGYEKAMKKGLELMQTDLQAASQQFERVAKAEKENWLPAYYAALCNVNNSWGQLPKEKTLQHMNKAQEFINDAELISENNPELMVLQGMLNTCWITYDSRVYGMKLSGPTTALYEKAIQIAPENPRVLLAKAEWDMGSAKFFGQSIQPYCEDVQKALSLFDTEEVSDVKFYPDWGKKRAQQILEEDCED